MASLLESFSWSSHFPDVSHAESVNHSLAFEKAKFKGALEDFVSCHQRHQDALSLKSAKERAAQHYYEHLFRVEVTLLELNGKQPLDEREK